MSATKKTFCIAHKINPDTDRPFGDKYGEPITLRRPSAADKALISTRHIGAMSSFGANPAFVPESISTITYIFFLLDTLFVGDTKTRPGWTQRENVYEEDESAVFSLYEEVSLWLQTFRPGRTQPEGAGDRK